MDQRTTVLVILARKKHALVQCDRGTSTLQDSKVETTVIE